MIRPLGSRFLAVWGLVAVMAHLAPVTTAQGTAPPQSADVYEVVSVKPSGPSAGPSTAPMGLPGGRFEMVNLPVNHLLAYAFRVRWEEIDGIPSWVSTDRYMVRATAAAGNATPAMARNMLASRFKLQAHYEQRRRPAYVLTVARKDGLLGPGLVPLAAPCERGTRVRLRAAGPRQGDELRCISFRSPPGLLQAVGMTFPQIADLLSNLVLHRRVVNRTALEGYFDLNLAYSPEPSAPDRSLSLSQAPPLPVAMEEQLGLKLETQEVPTTVLVVEHIERPTED